MQQKLTLGGLAWPIFVESFLAKAMGMVNIFLLSTYNQEAVAAIGVSNQLINFILMMFFFVTLGMAVIVSQNLGAGNEEYAASTCSAAIMLNVGLGLIVGLAVLFFHRPILQLMGLSGTVLDYAAVYFCIIGGLSVIQGVTVLLATMMRNYGQPRVPMFIFLSMNILNLIGNAIIVSHPFASAKMGIGAIAICTILSQSAALAAMIVCIKRFHINLRFSKRIPFSIVKQIYRVGIPGAGDALAYNVAWICLTSFVAAMGTASLAALTYAQNYIALVQQMGYSVGQGSQILVGRYVGAGETDRAYRLAYRGTWIAIALNMAAILAVLIFNRPLLHLFTKSEEIIGIVFICFVIDVVIEFGRPFNMVIGTGIRGAGDVKWAIAASASSILLVCIPLGYVFTHFLQWGVPGVFVALCVDEWLRGQLMNWRWRSRKWEKFAVVKEVEASIPQ